MSRSRPTGVWSVHFVFVFGCAGSLLLHVLSLVAAHGLNCSKARGIFLDWRILHP